MILSSTTLDNISSSEDADVTHISKTLSSTNRVSMNELYGQQDISQSADCPVDGAVDSPPSYEADALLQKPPMRRKFNIQPREDEGRETLPPYSSEISLNNVFQRKMELEGAVHRARDRNWYRTWVTLQGTALTLHKVKSGFFPTNYSCQVPLADVALPGKKGKFVKSYNLQHADVGIAADYLKKRYVIRIRAECDQFLITCLKMETFVTWLQSLFAAIDIAPPLDTRSLPRDLSIPRSRRRRTTCSSSFTDIERNADLIREQLAIMREQYPRLVDAPIGGGGTNTTGSRPATSTSQYTRRTSSSNGAMPPSFGRPSRPETRSSLSSQSPTFSHQPSRRPSQQSTRNNSTCSTSSSEDEVNPSLSPTGKWAPPHHRSATHDMIYAKRCMAILTHRSPRKSNYVILKGKQWIIDWTTGVLTQCEPPAYGECVVEELVLVRPPR